RSIAHRAAYRRHRRDPQASYHTLALCSTSPRLHRCHRRRHGRRAGVTGCRVSRTGETGVSAPDPGLLSLNTATVRKQWGLAQAIAGCARHGIRGISPWRDQLREMGLEAAAHAIRGHGLSVTGLCRGGLFPAADAAGRYAAIEENLRAINEAHVLSA